jgi:hypothetical protein
MRREFSGGPESSSPSRLQTFQRSSVVPPIVRGGTLVWPTSDLSKKWSFGVRATLGESDGRARLPDLSKNDDFDHPPVQFDRMLGARFVY